MASSHYTEFSLILYIQVTKSLCFGKNVEAIKIHEAYLSLALLKT